MTMANCVLSALEPGGLVHDIAQRLAKGKAPAVIKQDVEATIIKVRAEACGVGRDQYVGCCPERMVGGQGLDLENVEAGSRDLSGVQCGHKVGEAHGHATADIDQKGTRFHATEPLAVDQTFGGRSVRDRHDK